MKISFDNNIPIYIQLVELLKVMIISGEIKPGEKLLSVRELAIKYKVNPNTMQKALSELEDIKLIYTERTNGKYVTDDKNLIMKLKNEYAKNITNKFFDDMSSIGFTKDETIKYMKGMK